MDISPLTIKILLQLLKKFSSMIKEKYIYFFLSYIKFTFFKKKVYLQIVSKSFKIKTRVIHYSNDLMLS